MSDIVERLKKYNEDWRTRAGLAKEVADAIAEIERLRAALQRIADPIQYLQEYAKERGREVNGRMAVHIASDPNWMKNEAAMALSLHATEAEHE